MFCLTGIFAICGGLYTWGAGSIFDEQSLEKALVPIADILITGPLSLIAGIGIFRHRYWGRLIGLSVGGIYIFGSTLVIIGVIWNHSPDLTLILPAVFGALLAGSYMYWMLVKNRFNNRTA